MRKEVEEGGEWGEIDNFFGGTGEIRELRIKTGPSKGIRLAIERNLNKPGEEIGDTNSSEELGVEEVQCLREGAPLQNMSNSFFNG